MIVKRFSQSFFGEYTPGRDDENVLEWAGNNSHIGKSTLMDENTVRQKLSAYITAQFIHDAKYPLTHDEGIITEDLIDSFAFAELAVFVEKTFGVYIPEPDLTTEKMNTLNQIVARDESISLRML